MLAFHIGGQESEYVRVAILGDNGDGWFSAEVEVAVGAFRGTYAANFNSWAFSNFRGDLKRLYRSVSGSASFTSYEQQLEITMTCNAQGHIEARGEAVDLAGTGNRLVFRLEIDQTYLPKILADLQSALERFPPRAV
jgi:hypothetical protein